MIARLSFCFLLLAGLAAFAGRATAHHPAGPHPKSPARPAVTTIYLVRHGEKDLTTDPADPALSAAGQARARALGKRLAGRRPAALFTTDTRRTRATLAPLATATGLVPQVYNPRDNNALATQLRQQYAGKTVVVVGHSNTLLPLIEALGGTPPVQEIGDNEYDYLFTVRLRAGALPTVQVEGYGPRRNVAPTVPAPPSKTE